MNYKVLYRKYRPKNFGEIVGQNNAVELLKDSIDNNRISHAYIFSGPRGTGKTSTAKIFAKAINCSCTNGEKPCGKCTNCLNFAQSNDIYEIDAASNNGVDQIREIIDNIKLSPITSKYKVYIIDEVHMLSTSAFNALLLTLEEPPSHVVFILATTDIEDVPITVLSRCQRLDFKKISNNDIKYVLKNVSENEKIEIEDSAIDEIAEFSDGGLRDALSILDQLSKAEEKITQEMVLESVGLVSTKNIVELFENIDKNDIEKVLEFVNKVRENNSDFKSLIKRIIQIVKCKAIDIKKGYQKSRLSYADCKNLCFQLTNTLYKNNVHVDLYSLLELILLDYIELSPGNNDLGNISQKIISVKKGSDVGRNDFQSSIENVSSPYMGNISKLIDVRINNCFVKANKTQLQKSKEYWKKFVETIEDKRLKGLILDTEIVLASDKIFVIKTDFQEKSDNINKELENFESEFNKIINKNIKLVSISQKKWNSEMEKYKENKKNNIEYNYMNEPTGDECAQDIDDIFVTNKIEVK